MKAAMLRDFRPLFVKKTLPGQNYEQVKTVLRRYTIREIRMSGSHSR